MSEHIAVEPRTDGESKPSERSCCGITNCGDRFHRRLEHWTDRRFNVRPKHNAEPDHSSARSEHDSAWNDKSEQHDSGDGGTGAWNGSSNSGNCNARDYTESDISPDDSDTTDAGDHTNIANAGNHTDITDTRINTNIAGSGNNKSS